jgi:uncharacterized protein YkwD
MASRSCAAARPRVQQTIAAACSVAVGLALVALFALLAPNAALHRWGTPATLLHLGGGAEVASAQLGSGPAPEESPEESPADARTEETALEHALLALTNADRAASGLAPLAYDPDVLPVARARATAQLPLPRLSHYDGAGRTAVADLLAAAGARYRLAGENLARVPGDHATAAARAAAALLDSPAHRANILEPSFDRLAVGVAVDDGGRVIFAQVFRQVSPP